MRSLSSSACFFFFSAWCKRETENKGGCIPSLCWNESCLYKNCVAIRKAESIGDKRGLHTHMLRLGHRLGKPSFHCRQGHHYSPISTRTPTRLELFGCILSFRSATSATGVRPPSSLHACVCDLPRIHVCATSVFCVTSSLARASDLALMLKALSFLSFSLCEVFLKYFAQVPQAKVVEDQKLIHAGWGVCTSSTFLLNHRSPLIYVLPRSQKLLLTQLSTAFCVWCVFLLTLLYFLYPLVVFLDFFRWNDIWCNCVRLLLRGWSRFGWFPISLPCMLSVVHIVSSRVRHLYGRFFLILNETTLAPGGLCQGRSWQPRWSFQKLFFGTLNLLMYSFLSGHKESGKRENAQ